MNALILCDGDPPSESLFRSSMQHSDLFIAADGGGNYALKKEIEPDYVIGDLDSFEYSHKDDSQIIHEPEQQTNDLEKALALAKKLNITRVKVMGATGQRLDHTLKNLSVLKRYNAQFEKIIIRDNFGDTFLIPKQFTADWPVGTPISLFPLSGVVTGITTHGLKYSLKDEELENGVRDGTSNITVKSPVEISYRTGDLLIYLARKENNS